MTRNSELLDSFVAFCREHPDSRFWQALLNWSKHRFIFIASERPVHHDESFIWREHEVRDPYNWETIDGK